MDRACSPLSASLALSAACRTSLHLQLRSEEFLQLPPRWKRGAAHREREREEEHAHKSSPEKTRKSPATSP